MGLAVAVAAAVFAVLSGIQPGAAPEQAAEAPGFTMQVTRTYMDGRVVVDPPVRFVLD